MRKLLATIAVVAGLATSANAAYLSSFSDSTNDGVFTLTTQQATQLGNASADRIGILRIADGLAGDTFDQNTILNSTLDDAAILGILNGSASSLSYTGVEFDELGTTTLLADFTIPTRFDFVPGVYFLFNSASGNIVFNGTSTFNPADNRGAFELAPVPLPAAAWMLIAGLGGLFAFGRRRAA